MTLKNAAAAPPLHVLHIGKTGGTALKHALRQPAPSGWRLHLHPHAIPLSAVPEGEKVVFFLRDPISRFVSGFNSRRCQGRPRYHSPWSAAEERAFQRFATPDALGRALASEQPEVRATAVQAMRDIEHVRDSFWRWLVSPAELRRRSADLLFIGQQEYLAGDVAVLAGWLATTLQLPDDPVLAHRNPPELDRNLSETARDALLRWYAADAGALLLCAISPGSAASAAHSPARWPRRTAPRTPLAKHSPAVPICAAR